MKRIRLLALLACIILLAGCSASREALQQQPPSDQSIWRLLDADGNFDRYLFEDDEDVKGVMDIVQRHIACVDNRSADDVMYAEEKETCTANFIKLLEQNDYESKLIALYTANGLAIRSAAVYWGPSTFNAGRTECKVDVESAFQFVDGSETYLDSLGVVLEKTYIEHRIYYCVRTEDGWRIANIEKSALTNG